MIFKRYISLILVLTCTLTGFSARRQTASSLEKTFSDHFPRRSPCQWKPGDRFIYSLDRLNITIKPEKPMARDTANYKDRIFTFTSIKSQSDWIGNESINLCFESQGKMFFFETGKTLAQYNDTTYNPLIAGLIDYEEITRADSLLKGLTLYVLTSDWLSDTGRPVLESRKFVPVIITGVSRGNDEFPVRIYFSYDDVEYYVYTVLSGTLNSSTRREFLKQFADENPQKKYKDISNENWKLITAGKVAIDMTAAEVRLSMGTPAKVERFPTYSGLIQKWIYNSGTMVTLQNDIVVGYRK